MKSSKKLKVMLKVLENVAYKYTDGKKLHQRETEGGLR